jgi:hypothetical protein
MKAGEVNSTKGCTTNGETSHRFPTAVTPVNIDGWRGKEEEYGGDSGDDGVEVEAEGERGRIWGRQWR